MVYTEVSFHCIYTVYVYTLAVNATVAAELPTNMSSTGAVVVAVVAVVGLLLLVGIAVVVVIAVVLR